jgi:hypothetical protein
LTVKRGLYRGSDGRTTSMDQGILGLPLSFKPSRHQAARNVLQNGIPVGFESRWGRHTSGVYSGHMGEVFSTRRRNNLR